MPVAKRKVENPREHYYRKPQKLTKKMVVLIVLALIGIKLKMLGVF